MSHFNRPIDAAGDPAARIEALLLASETLRGVSVTTPSAAADASASADSRDVAERLLGLDVWGEHAMGMRSLKTQLPPLEITDVVSLVDIAVDRVLAALK